MDNELSETIALATQDAKFEKPSDKDLCAALSEVFLDNKLNYEYISRTTRHFEPCYVKMAFFDWVSPELYGAFLTPIPPWGVYDTDELWSDIQKKLEREKKHRHLSAPKIFVRRMVLGLFLRGAWRNLSRGIAEFSRHS